MDTGSSHGRMMTVMVDTDHLALRTQVLGALPIIDHFLERLGVMEVLERYLAPSDRRLRLPAAKALGVLVCTLVIHKEPVYALGEWARAFDPSVFGVRGEEIRLLNDDRLGRALDRLFDADRATLLTELVVGAIDRFGIDCTQLHNDSTTVTFSGDYRFATGRPRGSLLPLRRRLQAGQPGDHGSHRRAGGPVPHAAAAGAKGGGVLPGVAPDPHPPMERDPPPARAPQGRARRGLDLDAVADPLGRGLPHRVDLELIQGAGRCLLAPGAHRGRLRRPGGRPRPGDGAEDALSRASRRRGCSETSRRRGARRAEGHPAGGTGVLEEPCPHRGSPAVPLHRHARPGPDRAGDPPGHGHGAGGDNPALPGGPGLRGSDGGPGAGDLLRFGPSPPHRGRTDRADLSARAVRPPTGGLGTPRHLASGLHRWPRLT